MGASSLFFTFNNLSEWFLVTLEHLQSNPLK